MNKLLDIDNLQVEFDAIRALDGVSLSLAPAARMGIVGESGSGKSTLGLAVLGLLPEAAHSSGQVRFNGTPLPWHDDVAMTALRGNRIGFIHRDPMGAFSPVHTIGTHLARAYLAANPGTSRAGVRKAAIDRLDEVEIADAKSRLAHYPHEFSGGMRQRVMIAAALIGSPDLLIADEPTTALDVTTQAAVLAIINAVVEARGMGLILITHDLGVVAELCRDVTVMYNGRLIQTVPVSGIAERAHPYTRALLRARPRPGMRGARLPTIADMLPVGWADA